MSNILPFRRSGHEPDEPETGPGIPAASHELEIIEPTVVELSERPSYRLNRPTVAGAKRAAKQGGRAFLGRLVFELFKGMPVRLVWLIKVWVLGLVLGLVRLIPWLFAGDIRSNVKISEHADRYAKWRLSLFAGGHLVVLVGLGVLVVKTQDRWPFLGLKPFWSIPIVWALVALAYGIHRDDKPRPQVMAPRQRTDATTAAMNEALLGMGQLKPVTAGNQSPGRVTVSAMPKSVGGGHETTWTLPVDCGKSATDIIALRERLAGAFATPLDQFHVRVGRHAAELVIWQTDRDPFGGAIPRHPLVHTERWDVWDPNPWALNYKRQVVYIGWVFTSVLIGARPRQGKSFAARSALVGPILDPSVSFACFNGKGGPTWEALQPMCRQYVTGGDEDEVRQVAAELAKLVAEMRARHRRIAGSKLTPTMAKDPTLDLGVKIIVVDEAQLYVNHEQYGKAITQHLLDLAKVGPSAGMSLCIITQNPHSEGFPSQLKSVMGARMALPVMSFHDSNVILGPDMSKLGFDASLIMHRGVGYFRPDEDANGQPDSFDRCQLVRSYAIGAEQGEDDWLAMCARGIQLRREAGRELPELEAGEPVRDELLPATRLFDRFTEHAPQVLPDHVVDPQSLGNWLSVPTRYYQRQNVRSLREVERAVGLAQGSLSGLAAGVAAESSNTERKTLATPEQDHRNTD